MKNRKSIKCLLAAFAMVMVLSLTGITANAATKTDSFTLLVGEKLPISYIGMGTIKSVSSSKSKVAKAQKKGSGIQITAKKAGKTNVTVKGSRGNTFIHKITVAKANFKVTPITFIPNTYGGGDLVVSIKNNTPAGIDWFDVNFSFKNAAGVEVESRTFTAFYVGKKQTATGTVYISDVSQVDFNQTSYTLKYRRSADAKYSNYAKKVKFSESRDGNYINITAKTKSKYKGNGTISIAYEITYYDAAGNIIDMSDYTASLSSTRQSNTTQIYVPSDAANYSINKRVQLRTY